MEKKLRVVQVGMRHEHANGKLKTLRECCADVFELVGVVDEGIVASPTSSNENDPVFEGVPHLTMDAALALTDIDCVLIEVPNLELVPTAWKFAKKGIPMHLDKPAGESLEDYAVFMRYCEEHRVPVQMGYMYRTNPALKKIRELYRAGALGDIFEVYADMHHNYGGSPYQEYLSRFKGGIMFNLGCHLVDFTIDLLGAPDKITGYLKSAGDGVPDTVLNNVLAVLEYPRAMATLRICSQKPGSPRLVRVAGTNGWAELEPIERYDGIPLTMRVYLRHPMCGLKEGEQVLTFAPYDRYEAQLRELAAIVCGEKSPDYSYAHDILVHQATLAAAGY